MTRALQWIALVIVLSCLAGCGTAPATEQATRTNAAEGPAAAPTKQPLVSVDLEPLLIQAGDLPAGVTGAQVRDTPPKMFDGMPKAAKAVYQQLAQGNQQTGGVAVFLYETGVDAGYAFAAKGMGDVDPVADVGEQAIVTKAADNPALNFVDLLFRRCAAVVHTRMSGADLDRDTAAAYAKRLDARLKPVVC